MQFAWAPAEAGLTAKLAGGANLFPNLSMSSTSIGQQNINAVVEPLKEARNSSCNQDVAAVTGAKMRFFVENGVVTVTSVGQRPRRDLR